MYTTLFAVQSAWLQRVAACAHNRFCVLVCVLVCVCVYKCVCVCVCNLLNCSSVFDGNLCPCYTFFFFLLAL